MDYLNNTLKIIHRDLKGENVFLEFVKKRKQIVKLKAVIGDFGCSLHEGNLEQERLRYECGTLRWKVYNASD